MTLQQQIESRLIAHGLCPHEAADITATLKESEGAKMADRWAEESDAFPPELPALMWFMAKQHAMAYLDATRPRHFARAIIANSP